VQFNPVRAKIDSAIIQRTQLKHLATVGVQQRATMINHGHLNNRAAKFLLRKISLCWILVLLVSVAPAHAFPVVVEDGDTLAGIAQRIYGRVQNEMLLVSANGLDARGGIAIVPGLRIEVPAVSFRRTAQGETWPELARQLLGGRHRAAVLAFANDSKPWLLPTDNAEILVPYNLRYVASGGETTAGLASRFLGNKKRAWMLSHYNGIKTAVLDQGQVVLIPLTDLPLTDEGRRAARRAAVEGGGQAGGERRALQTAAEVELVALLSDIRAGRYVEAVARGVALLASAALTTPQQATVHRQLLEAYTALGASGRARGACQGWQQAAPDERLDPVQLSPKLLSACSTPSPP
jgi:hypothetical protein